MEPFITSMIATWFTPTLLFIFLNLMIATILFTSNKLPAQRPQNQTDSILNRSPSILHRLKSLNLYPHRSEPSPLTNHQQQSLQIPATQYVFNHPFTHQQQDPQPVSTNPINFNLNPTRIEYENPPEQDTEFVETHEEEEDDDLESLDEVYSKITGVQVNRTKSDTLPASGEVPVRLPAKMKKSASLKSAFSHFEEDKIVEIDMIGWFH